MRMETKPKTVVDSLVELRSMAEDLERTITYLHDTQDDEDTRTDLKAVLDLVRMVHGATLAILWQTADYPSDPEPAIEALEEQEWQAE